MAKKLFIKTYGCQMNVYDSARMADVLAPLGYGPTDSAEGADMVILNTCHIREKASEKVFAELGRLKAAKRARQADGADMIIAVAGCVAQAEGEEIMRRAPYVDVVLGPQTYHRLPEMVARAFRTAAHPGRGAGILDTEFPVESKFDHLPETAAPPGNHGIPDGAGGLRQVLHVLRRAVHARRRVLAQRRRGDGGGAAPGQGRRARDHAARPERQCLSRCLRRA